MRTLRWASSRLHLHDRTSHVRAHHFLSHSRIPMPFGVSTRCLTVRRVKWVQPFRPAHNLIRPPPRSFLPCRRRIHNSVVHQRRSPLPCRRSILLRRSASLHRSRTAAPGSARGLALLRNSGMPEGPLFYFPFSFFFLSFLFLRVFLRFLRDTSSSFSKMRS